jgi:hypothetical protein
MSTFMEHIHREADTLPLVDDTAWPIPGEYEPPSPDQEAGGPAAKPAAHGNVADVLDLGRAPRLRADAVR